MSPAFNGSEVMSDVDISAIVERLDAQSKLLERQINQADEMLSRIGDIEKWQSNTDAVLDSLTERVDEVTDKSEKNTDWINEQKGWSSGRSQMILQAVQFAAIIAMLIKMVLWHS